MLKDGALYQDLGADHFDKRHGTLPPDASSSASRTLGSPYSSPPA
jgi:hypothetical protein